MNCPYQGIGAAISIFSTIEKLLWSINQRPNAIRSPLASWTGDSGIDAFIGLDICFEAILPPLDPWKVSSHRVLTATELLRICESSGSLPELETIEIAWMWPEDFQSTEFDKYFSQITAKHPHNSFKSLVLSGVDTSPCRQLALDWRTKFNTQGKLVVFCNVRRGEIAFVDSRKLLSYVTDIEQNSHFHVYTKSYAQTESMSTALDGRFIPMNLYVQSIHDVIERHGRDSLFIVVSTDGYSKLFQALGELPTLVKPIDNYLIDVVNSEFAEIKQLSDLFLPGDSCFHTRQSIIYSAISDILISGVSAFPETIKKLFGFSDFAEVDFLKAL